MDSVHSSMSNMQRIEQGGSRAADAAAADAAAPRTVLLSLPDDCLLHVAKQLADYDALTALSQVCVCVGGWVARA
jgi:hypothetical protein